MSRPVGLANQGHGTVKVIDELEEVKSVEWYFGVHVVKEDVRHALDNLGCRVYLFLHCAHVYPTVEVEMLSNRLFRSWQKMPTNRWLRASSRQYGGLRVDDSRRTDAFRKSKFRTILIMVRCGPDTRSSNKH